MSELNQILTRIKEAIRDKRGSVKTQVKMAEELGIQESSLSLKLKTTKKGRTDDLTQRQAPL